MNTLRKSENLQRWLVMFLVVVVVGMNGCSYNRATEDGALARVGFNLEILPSGSSDDTLALSNRAIKTAAENADKVTNAHDSGIKKTRARTKVTTTTTTGPSREYIRN